MPLELESLQSAIASLGLVLEKGAEVSDDHPADAVLRTAVQSGVIKHFEFTYELSWKFIKRWLEVNVSRTAADGVTRRELFRMGFENLLIDDVDRWMDYHQARNQTSHTYRKTTDDEVYSVIPAFLDDARLLLAALEARDD